MGITVNLKGEALDRIASALERLSDALWNIAHKTPAASSGKATVFHVTQIADKPRIKESIMVEVGNKFWDQIAATTVSVKPNGTIDSPPTWTPDGSGVTVTPSADGLSCDIGYPEGDVASWTVTVQAPADNPSTPELESVTETFHGSCSHSKATALTGSVGADIPRA